MFESIYALAKTVGRVFTIASTSKKVYDFATEDREAKRKAKEAAEREKSIREQAERIANRNVFETLAMYAMGIAAGAYVSSLGWLGLAFVVLLVLTHCSQLLQISKLTNISREAVLTVVMSIGIVISWFIL